jgi:hypothetical protein
MTQRYTDITAVRRMKEGRCPECGQEVGVHTGWGAIGCSLSDNGVAQRIWEFQQPPEHIVDPQRPEYTFCGKTARLHRSTGDLDAAVRCRECSKASDSWHAAEDATWD